MIETTNNSGWHRNALLSVAEMYEADKAAIAAGVSGPTLMENAGRAIAREILMRWKARPTSVLCGPGNNGGDGFVVARLLAEASWPVRVFLLGERANLRGDAAWAAGLWNGEVEPLSEAAIREPGLVVDALFGAGLDRPLTGIVKQVVEKLAGMKLVRVAVDVPSGVSGDSGATLGTAAPADLTVTFFRRKPGHLLLPGRSLCGETVVADIGIPQNVLTEIDPQQARNSPALWRDALRAPEPEDHKYTRGHLGVIAGPMTGAARLAATAAGRAGTGMVSVLKPREEVADLGSLPASLVVSEIASPKELAAFTNSRRISALVAGPGRGRSPLTKDWVRAALQTDLPCVIDADGLSAFADNPSELFDMTRGRAAVMTPHEGEFGRLFDGTGDKVDRARNAARTSGAVVLLKGADTVIAAPDGRAVINDNAPPWLATAGAGDALAGVIAGLLARKVPPFWAACAGAWLTGDAANRLGDGLTADDLAIGIPASVRSARGKA